MKRKCESFGEFCKSERKMFSDKNKIDETSGLSFIVICDNKIILFYEQKLVPENLAFNITIFKRSA